MKKISFIFITMILCVALVSCNSSAVPGQESSQAAAVQSAQPSTSASAPSASESASAQASSSPVVSSSASAESSSSASSNVLPDDDPSVTGDESALVTDDEGIITQLPLTKNMADGQYTGIIANLFNVEGGKAVDFDEVQKSNGEVTNENQSIVFLQLSDTISYTLPDDIKKENVDISEISDLEEYISGDYYFTITVSNSLITKIAYGGAL